MNHTTPNLVNEDVSKFCREIDSSSEPFFVDVIPSEESEHQECFINVQEYIKKYGGKIQYGWTIWETPQKFVEAEFHAILIDKNEKYTDITPKPDGEKRILFLKDSKRKFTGELVNNIRKKLADTAEIRTKIIMGNRLFELSEKYYDGSKIEIPFFEMNNLAKLEKDILSSEIQKDKLDGKIRIGRNELCPCGSEKKYKKCCLNC